MMTIEGVLHLRGSEMDLYAPQYFANEAALVAKIKEGNVLLLGQELINHSPTVVTLDADKFAPSISNYTFTFENRVIMMDKRDRLATETWNTDPTWRMSHPPIPPGRGYASATEMVNMQRIQSRYLSNLDSTAPIYYSLDQGTENIVFVDDPLKPNDLIFAVKSFKLNISNILFFVNGLCCLPKIEENAIYGRVVRLVDAKTILWNQTDRKRGIVFVDFSNQCDVSYYTTKLFTDDFPKMGIDTSIDIENSSFLLVLDGRLYLPSEFSVLNNHTLHIEKTMYRPEYILDRMCCENKFSDVYESNGVRIARTRDLVAEDVDPKTTANSFLVVFNKKGLRIVEHDPNERLETEFLERKLDPYSQHKIHFNAVANGLLFDRATRSVVDYTREENDMTFYDGTGNIPRRWVEMTAMISHTTPLKLWQKCDNDMSASAMMHDRCDVRGSGFVLWPKYTLLDFLFEG